MITHCTHWLLNSLAGRLAIGSGLLWNSCQTEAHTKSGMFDTDICIKHASLCYHASVVYCVVVYLCSYRSNQDAEGWEKAVGTSGGPQPFCYCKPGCYCESPRTEIAKYNSLEWALVCIKQPFVATYLTQTYFIGFWAWPDALILSCICACRVVVKMR